MMISTLCGGKNDSVPLRHVANTIAFWAFVGRFSRETKDYLGTVTNQSLIFKNRQWLPLQLTTKIIMERGKVQFVHLTATYSLFLWFLVRVLFLLFV